MDNTNSAIVVGDRVVIVKGNSKDGLNKNVTARVTVVDELGPEYSHSVRVVLVPVNGFGAGRSFVYYARHINRMSDPVVNLNTGNPLQTLKIRKSVCQGK